MATTTLTETPVREGPVSAPKKSRDWLVSPQFDLLFLVNCLWPLLFLVGFQSNLAGHDSLLFWQIYFVTTPHRWITLFLVAGDPARFGERPRTFLGLGLAIVGGSLLVYSATGALTCLLAVDYIWNAWHFAAQHHGIYRIYARKADSSVGSATSQKWLFRLSLLYIICRIAGWSWQFETFEETLSVVDFGLAALMLGMLAREWSLTPRSWGRSGYFTSVTLLYLALLAAVHYRRPDMVLVLATASALFHATEYLAIISWNVNDRERQQKSAGLIRQLAPVWIFFLIAFAVTLGVAGWYADQYWLELWLAVNVMMAFVHYSFDGLIWRRPRPAR